MLTYFAKWWPIHADVLWAGCKQLSGGGGTHVHPRLVSILVLVNISVCTARQAMNSADYLFVIYGLSFRKICCFVNQWWQEEGMHFRTAARHLGLVSATHVRYMVQLAKTFVWSTPDYLYWQGTPLQYLATWWPGNKAEVSNENESNCWSFAKCIHHICHHAASLSRSRGKSRNSSVSGKNQTKISMKVIC